MLCPYAASVSTTPVTTSTSTRVAAARALPAEVGLRGMPVPPLPQSYLAPAECARLRRTKLLQTESDRGASSPLESINRSYDSHARTPIRHCGSRRIVAELRVLRDAGPVECGPTNQESSMRWRSPQVEVARLRPSRRGHPRRFACLGAAPCYNTASLRVLLPEPGDHRC